MRWTASVCASALFCACASDPASPDASVVDGGPMLPDATAQLEITPPAAAALPAAPVLTPCPAGWREVPPAYAEDVATCDPWPESGHATCATGEAHFPGEPGCARVGEDCPSGEWRDDLPVNVPVLYVRANMSGSGGTGTTADPFHRIQDAIAAAPGPVIIALGKGELDEPITLRDGVTLIGACVAETRLRAMLAAPSPMIALPSGTAAIRNLEVRGPRTAIAVGPGAAVLEVRGVAIEGASPYGIFVEGEASATIEGVVVRDSVPTGGAGGRALRVLGGEASASRVLFELSREATVSVAEGGVLTLDRAAVIGMPAADPLGGPGLLVLNGSRATVTAALFERSRVLGVLVRDVGSELTMTDAIIRDSSDTTLGTGLFVGDGGRATVSRLLAERNQESSLSAQAAASELELADVVVRDTRPQPGLDNAGFGLHAYAGSIVRGARISIRGSNLGGVVSGEGAGVSLTDVTIRDTTAGGAIFAESTVTSTRTLLERNELGGVMLGMNARGTFADLTVRGNTEGGAVDLAFGAQGTIRRALLDQNLLAPRSEVATSVLLQHTGTRLTLADAVVSDTSGTTSGGGIGAGREAALVLERVEVRSSAIAGIIIDGTGTAAMFDEVRITGTRSAEANGLYGRGLSAQAGASVIATRSIFEDNREVAIFANDANTTVDLLDVLITDTRERACVATTCPDRAGGSGVSSLGDAAVTMERFLVRGNALFGVQVATGGTMDLADGEIAGHPIGANVLTEGFDVQRLLQNVRYRDNGQNVDGTAAFVPDSSIDLRLRD